MKTIITVLCVAFCVVLQAQERTDTLPPAKKVAYQNIPDVSGGYGILKEDALRVVSPLGNGDPIKFVQTLSGVSTGPEGSSAVYVRGGGAGNTVVTLDGVPVLGQTHMLGLTTVVPSEMISGVRFFKDGFGEGLSGYTGAQINLYSDSEILTKAQKTVSLSTFLPGLSLKTPLRRGKSSMTVSARWSPLGQLFDLAGGLFKKNDLGIESLRTNIFDLYGKYNLRFSGSYYLYVSGFYSSDGYKYNTSSSSTQNLGWSNAIGQIRLVRKEDNFNWELSAHYNSFRSEQEKESYLNGAYNFLSAESTVRDMGITALYHWTGSDVWKINAGAEADYSVFDPGTNKISSGKASYSGNASLKSKKLSGFVQATYSFMEGKASASGNIRGTIYNLDRSRFEPEFSLSARYHILPELIADVSLSRTAQFVHTLEGMPLGWSTDLIVPTDSDIAPESAMLLSPGLYLNLPGHAVYVGAYYKAMDKLLYYSDATSLFGARRSVWKDYIEKGKGESYGLEFEYSYKTESFAFKAAYTLSKTDRTFPGVNDGLSFPAKYDRRHILNTSAEWTVLPDRLFITGAFTLQSGHWDTAKADQYGLPLLESLTNSTPSEVIVDYCSGINNYQHPNYIRADIGCRYEFGSDKVRHSLMIGIYNVLNRHNPFSLYYDTETYRWKTLSLIPILPNFSYRIEF